MCNQNIGEIEDTSSEKEILTNFIIKKGNKFTYFSQMFY